MVGGASVGGMKGCFCRRLYKNKWVVSYLYSLLENAGRIEMGYYAYKKWYFTRKWEFSVLGNEVLVQKKKKKVGITFCRL